MRSARPTLHANPLSAPVAGAGLLLLIVIALAGQASAQSESVAPADGSGGFRSDGCSLWPDGNYRDCCVEHDKAYFIGGGRKLRAAADGELFRCVRAKGRRYNTVVAPMMWVGVRLGGVGWLPTPFRWGFGNPYPATRPRGGKKDGEGAKGK
jgi:hypothetical protein